MILKLRRGLGAVSAWVALFAVAGIAYAARRRTPERLITIETDEPLQASEISPPGE